MEASVTASVVATAWALAFLVFFGQLSAKCLVPPQNMQRLRSRHLLHLSAVSFLSFPSLLDRSGLAGPDEGQLAGLEELE